MDSGSTIQFCDEAFWNINVTWETSIPDFTRCFQNVVLELVPCVCFCLVAVINLWRTRPVQGLPSPLPWTLLFVFKLVFAVLLELLTLVELAFDGRSMYISGSATIAQLCANCFKALSFVLIILMLLQHRKSGIITSSALSIFWFVLSLCGAVVYRSTFLQLYYGDIISTSKELFILDMFYYPLVFLQFVMSLFTATRNYQSMKDSLSLDEVPFFSFITFHWFNSIIYESTKKLMAFEDYPPLILKLRSRYAWLKFSAVWCKRIKKRNPSEQVEDCNLGSSDIGKNLLSAPSLMFTLVKSFWPWLLIAAIFELLLDVMKFFPSLILDLLISFVGSNEYMWRGYFYCVLLFASSVLGKFAFHLMLIHSMSAALQFKLALSSAVYRKAVKLSSDARKQYTVGELVNLMAVDIDKIFNFSQFFTSTFGAPLEIVVTIALLWQYLGPSCLAGVAVILIAICVSWFTFTKQHSVQERQMEAKDIRLKHMNELLNGIKVLKLCAWEIPFMKNIQDIRKREVKLIKAFQYCYAMFSFVWTCSPFLVAVASFATYVTVDEKNILDPSTAFVSLSLLNLLRYSVSEIPYILSELVQTNISLGRLKKFLIAKERDEFAVGETPDKGQAISIRNASFSWETDGESGLKEIDLQIPVGSLVAIAGSVGSGKSSLLSAILGDMNKLSGSVDISGGIAYVPQQAWILNETLKQNILFTKPLDETKYKNVISNCCLEPDLELLPGGDMTEIGEKGVNLSGGQKQRISLARAVYQNADVYLLDDPLSAVDAHVGKHLFDFVIGPNGMLRKKTRVLVTHSVAVLPDVDFVVSVKDGKIEEMGTYKELLQRNGPFANFIKEHRHARKESEDGDTVSPQITEIEPFGFVRTISLFQRSLSTQSVSVSGRVTSLETSSVKSMQRLVEEEGMEVGTVKKSVYLNYLRNASVRFICGLILGIFVNRGLEVGSNIWLSEWSSDPILPDGTQDPDLRNLRIGVYAGLGGGQAVAVLVGCFMLAFGAAQASKIFHQQMLESVMKSPMSFFDTTPLGRIINRFGKDMDVVDTNIPMDVDAYLSCLVSILATCVVIGMNTPIFLASLIPIGAIYFFVQKLYLVTTRQIQRLDSTSRSPVYSHFSETMHGVSSIRAYCVQEEFTCAFEKKIDTNASFFFYGICANRWLGIRLEILGNTIVLVTSILSVASRGTMDAAIVGLSLTYALSITEALLWAVRSGTALENHLVSVERIDEYSNLTPEAPWTIADSRPPSNWPTEGYVSFNNYSTRYRKNLDLVLKSISLDISSNEKVGIVGRTGAGKSSITLALFRIIEAVEGNVIIDGVDVAKVGLHDLRSNLTIIPQDPVLFTGSLRMNLDPNDKYSDEELWRSLEHAHLKDFVTSLKEGLNFDILEGGENMSVGQRQLVCLARALLKKTRILVLDEATAAVDMETDRLIQNTIRQEFEKYTVITIAHRLHTIMDYDKVVVMDAGEVVEVGKPSELLQNRNSLFFSLAKNARLA